MPTEVLAKFGATTALTMTLASLATLTGRQSTMIDNETTRAFKINLHLIVKTGTAPTAGTTIDVYLIRSSDNTAPNYRSDGAGASDAAWTPDNAEHIGSLAPSADADTLFYLDVVIKDLGKEWGIGLFNGTDQSLHATEGDHVEEYYTSGAEVQ